MTGRCRVGKVYPPGASLGEGGVNFSVFSRHAAALELCLFDGEGLETARLPMVQQGFWWCLWVDGLGAGQAYGFRAHGPWEPTLGHRFNRHKLLLDPYARALTGVPRISGASYAHVPGQALEDALLDETDNAGLMPKCLVLDVGALPPFEHAKPGHAMAASVLYELHLKGFSMGFPGIEESKRGTFAALAEPAVLAYFQSLRISAIELLPVQAFFSEPFLLDKGLVNYWGYNSIGFMAPHSPYGDIAQFRAMVDALHGIGVEVILDVVYNHSAEGNRLGPIYSFRGLDNACYYRLSGGDGRFYINDSGCGNTLDLCQPQVLTLVMDSLRYWVEVGGVDGFRFDLAACLGRESYGFDPGAGFFDALAQDPVLRQVKLIAEPWDVGPGGYQLGHFPVSFSEWNDRYRDTLRRLWRGDPGMLPEFARRFHGSSDLFEHTGRGPAASINFICSHDGFTLRDLLSFTRRHNEANGEDNRDGHNENFSSNHGLEGGGGAGLEALRQRKARSLLACLLLSQGVPMLLAGDELWHSQRGNNNAYCQDNAIGWIDWQGADPAMQRFTADLIAIRRRFGFLCRERYIHCDNPAAPAALAWFSQHGEPMSRSQWSDAHCTCLSLLLSCREAPYSDALLVMLNTGSEPLRFLAPAVPIEGEFHCLLSSADSDLVGTRLAPGGDIWVPAMGVLLFHGTLPALIHIASDC
ncbi:glycogen debranching protein GlgX [Shewanella sedimentimangrovi]|uniref:Glycogen debranching protein GlgX n=1 Tax=Shewanella sedimentimangrovi TaxID=2814293 RepID=A0ABX7R5Z6_9GAMM|nr:glycogen debranching protein GlgX [Shewanella sedimentimangrovi]QSX38210.1 glycogen debranching protein GlgX [Shewanella sedimentimangrovi]